jgi:hypothetical protein
MMKYSKIWANGRKKVDDDDEVIPWIAASKSSDQKYIFTANVFRGLITKTLAVSNIPPIYIL